MDTTLTAGSTVRFQAPLSNGGVARWVATVVRVEGEVAFVRHPQQARSFPFSPVAKPGLYRYHVATLVAGAK